MSLAQTALGSMFLGVALWRLLRRFDVLPTEKPVQKQPRTSEENEWMEVDACCSDDNDRSGEDASLEIVPVNLKPRPLGAFVRVGNMKLRL